jgi:hypothetical protein
MIIYKNRARKLHTKEEEIEAVRRCNGKAKSNGNLLEVVECVLNRTSVSPIKKHGFQDTEILHDTDGTITIIDYTPGVGMLKFEPSRYGNPVAYCDLTEHNRNMLVRHYRDKEWTISDKAIALEIEKAHEIWWSELPKSERDRIVAREEYRKRDQFSLPSQTGKPNTDASGADLLNEVAQLKEEKRKLEEANLQLKQMTDEKYGQPEKTEETKETEEPTPQAASQPEEAPKYPIITDTNGEELNFNKMLMFSIHKLARQKGIKFGKIAKREELVPQIIEKIKEEKKKEPVT